MLCFHRPSSCACMRLPLASGLLRGLFRVFGQLLTQPGTHVRCVSRVVWRGQGQDYPVFVPGRVGEEACIRPARHRTRVSNRTYLSMRECQDGTYVPTVMVTWYCVSGTENFAELLQHTHVGDVPSIGARNVHVAVSPGCTGTVAPATSFVSLPC
jgi:hypothetical protein